MSLPFLDRKGIASTIMERRNKDGSRGASAEVADEDGGEGDQLKDLSVDLLAAIERKSPGDIADAFRSMFEQCESEPHDEAGDDSDDSDSGDHDLFEMKG